MKKQAGDVWQEWWKSQEKMIDLWKESAAQFQPDKLIEVFDGQGKDLWQEWWNSQEKMLDQWKESVARFQPDKNVEIFNGQGKALWQDWYKSQEKLLNLWQEAMEKAHPAKTMDMFGGRKYMEWYHSTLESLGEYMKWAPTGVGKETYEKILQGSDFYMKLFSFWRDAMGKVPGMEDPEKWKEFSGVWTQQYKKLMDSFFALYLPEKVQELLKITTDTSDIFQKTFHQFFQPWLTASEELRELAARLLKGDREAYTEFFNKWREVYQQTYGKLLQVPAIGMSRESYEKLLGTMDHYQQYIGVVNEFYATMQKTGLDVMDTLLKNFSEMLAEGKPPQSFRDFYKIWWQTNEDAYLALFKTDGYAKLQGEVINAWSKAKKSYDEWLQEFLGKLSVPTNKEMDSLYKSVYQLKKVLKEQAQKLDEILGKMDTPNAKGGQNPS